MIASDSPGHRVDRTGKALRGVLWMLAGATLAALLMCAYFVFAPSPTDFAAGQHVPLAAYSAGDPTGVPAGLRTAPVVKRGEYLARAADCFSCHTARNGTPFAGGRPFVLPFGTLYSTNITPDLETGIGSYSDTHKPRH